MNTINPDNECKHLLKDVEYNADAFNEMLSKQSALQDFMEERRGYPSPTNKDTSPHEKAVSSTYYWTCATTEFFELMEAIHPYMDKDLSSIPPEVMTEIQYEYIDIWHFLMNVFLYAGIDQTNIAKLDEFYDATEFIDNDTVTKASTNICACFGVVSANVGQLINSLPFKVWKNYGPEDVLSKEDAEGSILWIMKAFVKLGKYINIDHKLFYSLYVTKNQENYDRQNRDGAYNSTKDS